MKSQSWNASWRFVATVCVFSLFRLDLLLLQQALKTKKTQLNQTGEELI
jgi:hypothetical protein